MRYEIRDSKMKYHDNWIVIESNNLRKFLCERYQEKMHVYDCDTCGTAELEIVVKTSDGSFEFFKVENSWYLNDNPWECVNEFYLDQITTVNFSYPSIDRNWLILK